MDNSQPTICHVCGRQAIGIGISTKHETHWLCAECSLIADRVRDCRRLNAYELKARAGGLKAAGELLERIGKTDLADFDEAEALMLCGAIWQGCGDGLRKLLVNGDSPF